MLRFFKLWWVFTAILFFATLMFSYAYLPDQVAVQSDEGGIASQLFSREFFFYGALIVFVIINLLSSLLLWVLTAVPVRQGTFFQSEEFKDSISSWFGGFVTILNVFLISFTLYIALYNNRGDYKIESFNFLLYVAPMLLIISLIWLVVLIVRR